ncbi:MAG: hypothetical protein FJW34_00045 [Acidobacteria bacterium]|nr:hypothetical protein [Acidobacteriota bacterium]
MKRWVPALIFASCWLALLLPASLGQGPAKPEPNAATLTAEDREAIRDLERKIYREDRVRAESLRRQADYEEQLTRLLRAIQARTGCRVIEVEDKLSCAEAQRTAPTRSTPE